MKNNKEKGKKDELKEMELMWTTITEVWKIAMNKMKIIDTHINLWNEKGWIAGNETDVNNNRSMKNCNE